VRIIILLLAALATAAPAWPGQDVSAEYRVKAGYLYNFVRFVEWPGVSSLLTICVAGRNPFGDVLEELVRGEVVNGRRLTSRIILEPDPACNVVFVPNGGPSSTYLRAARGTPTLTIGEAATFIQQGGIARFYVDGGNVRFEISPAAAEQSGLRISSRLLQLAKIAGTRGALP
jgi:hypothetical protein